MTLPPADHPIWKILRLAFVAVIMIVMLASQLIYKNPIEFADYKFVLVTVAGLGGFDLMKMFVTKEPKQ